MKKTWQSWRNVKKKKNAMIYIRLKMEKLTTAGRDEWEAVIKSGVISVEKEEWASERGNVLESPFPQWELIGTAR